MSSIPPSAHHKRVPRSWLPEEKSSIAATTYAGDFRAVSLELDEICNRDKDTSLGPVLTKSIMTDRVDFTNTNAGWNSFRVKPKPADMFRITTLSKLSEDQTSVSYIDPHTSLKTGRRLLRKAADFRNSKATISTSAYAEPASLSTTQRYHRAAADLSYSPFTKSQPFGDSQPLSVAATHLHLPSVGASTISHIRKRTPSSFPFYTPGADPSTSTTQRHRFIGASTSTSRSYRDRTTSKHKLTTQNTE